MGKRLDRKERRGSVSTKNETRVRVEYGVLDAKGYFIKVGAKPDLEQHARNLPTFYPDRYMETVVRTVTTSAWAPVGGQNQ